MVVSTHEMASVSKAFRACYSVEAELAIVAGVILAWQAIRIPLGERRRVGCACALRP